MKNFNLNLFTPVFLLSLLAAGAPAAWADDDKKPVYTEEEREACLDLERRNKVLDEDCQQILADESSHDHDDDTLYDENDITSEGEDLDSNRAERLDERADQAEERGHEERADRLEERSDSAEERHDDRDNGGDNESAQPKSRSKRSTKR